jgi:hypothetical protein
VEKLFPLFGAGVLTRASLNKKWIHFQGYQLGRFFAYLVRDYLGHFLTKNIAGSPNSG